METTSIGMSSVRLILTLALSLPAAGRDLIFEPTIRASTGGRGAVVVVRCGEPPTCERNCTPDPACPGPRVLTVAPASRSLELPAEFSQCANLDVTVFAYGHGAVRLTPPPGNGEIKVQLPPSTPIPAAAWIADSRIREKIMDEIVHVNWVLSENLAGIHLVPRYTDIQANEAPGNAGDACGWLEEDQSQIVDAQKVFQRNALNIYAGVPGSVDVNCNRSEWGSGPKASRSAVIFASSSLLLTNLTHEVSHALGLSNSDGFARIGTYSGGHTNGAPGFACSNTLWRREGLLENHMSIGQVYWANFHSGSLRTVLSAGDSAESGCAGGPCLPWCVDVPPHSGPAVPAAMPGESCEGPTPSRFLGFSLERLRDVRNRVMGRLDERSQCHVRRLIAAYETQRGCLACARDTESFTGGIAEILRDIALGRNEICTVPQLDVTLTQRFRQLEDFGIKNRDRLPRRSIQLGSAGAADFTSTWRPVFLRELRNRGMANLTELAAHSTPGLQDQAALAIREVQRKDPAFYADYLRYAERKKREHNGKARPAAQ